MTAIYNPADEPIVLSKSVSDLLLKQRNPSDLMALYQFYYYTAKWQKTNQPKATTKYVMEGLKWPEARVQKNKNKLIELRLIETVRIRNEVGRVTGHFILVKFIWSNRTITTISQGLGKQGVNALSTNSKLLSKDNIRGTAEADALEDSITGLSGIDTKTPIKGKRTKFTPVKQHHRVNPLIEYWNNLPHTRKHKDPSSKIYKQCSSMIRQLKQDTLGNNAFDLEWLKKHNIKVHHDDAIYHGQYLYQRYSDEGIKQGFDNLALMYMPGYWPQDKTWIKKLSLADLIYNPRAQNSWFLAYAIDLPKLLSKQLLDFQQGKDPMPDVTKKFKEWFEYKDSGMVYLLKKINGVVKFYRSLPKKIFEYGDFADFCPTEKKFCLHYLDDMKQGTYYMTDIGFKIYLDKHWDENSNALRKKLSTFLK